MFHLGLNIYQVKSFILVLLLQLGHCSVQVLLGKHRIAAQQQSFLELFLLEFFISLKPDLTDNRFLYHRINQHQPLAARLSTDLHIAELPKLVDSPYVCIGPVTVEIFT